MALATHADLIAAVGKYLHRSDLATVVPDFIVLAEAKLNRILRIRAMEATETGTVAATVALPTGCVEIISLTAATGTVYSPLTYAPPSSIVGIPTNSKRYTIVGENIEFINLQVGTYILNYYKKLDPLSAGANWLITNAPDVYLYATLVEAAPYINDDKRVSTWSQFLANSINQLMESDRRDRYGPNLEVRPA